MTENKGGGSKLPDVHEAVAELSARVAAVLEVNAGEIGEHDNLIEHGLDSIGAMRLAGEWRRAGIGVAFTELATEPTLAAWRVLLTNAAQTDREPATPTQAIDESAPFDLALMQHAYWVGRTQGQQLGGVAAHFYDEFDGTGVQPDRLEAAVRQVLARHGMLRVQVLDDGRQQILPESTWPGLTVHDLRDAPDWADRLLGLRTGLSHRQLDIAAGEVLDIQLSLLPDDATRVHVNLDMVAADAISLRVLLADLARCYEGETLPPIGYSFPAYQADRARPGVASARDYWQERLTSLPAAPQLPVATDAVAATTVVRRHRWLDPEALRTLNRWSRRHALTPAMTLAAVFAETLTRWSAEPDFLLNLPLFDREPIHPEVAGLVGDFTSSVLLAWEGSAPGSFADRAQRLQEQFHADAAHTAYSGVEVLRDLSRLRGEQLLAPVVYTSALGLGELFPREVRECFGEASWIISQGPQVWLDAQVTELNGGLLLNWDAREDAFAPGVLDAMFAAHSALIDDLLAGAEAWSQPVATPLPAAQAATRARVNDTFAARTPHRLHDGFFRTAAEQPERIALCWGADGQSTYGAVAAQALAVAGHLVAEGIEPGDLVAVSLPKGPEQVIAVLGVLAAGAAYVPIGIDQPALRKERICTAAGVRIVLDELVHAEPLAAPRAGADLAYVIYTSGSTGEPKGVKLTHAAAMNTIDDLIERFGIGADDRTLAISALDFDLSVFDLFGPLSTGGAVVLPQEAERRDATAWLGLVERHRATVLNCVPALLDLLLTAAEGPVPLRVVLLGGDWVTTDLPGRLAAVAPTARFAGLGGTTETAIHSTIEEVVGGVVPEGWTSVPYGVPLGNVACRVVDHLGRDCPDWVPGELWIGGDGVARGYRGDPERTADRFVILGDRRWYRTGDRARYWPDGRLEFLGRADHQVKVRGHRIELGEIESALTACPGVAQAIAAAVGPRTLGAVVTGAVSPDELRAALAKRLPKAMIPDRLTVLDALPLSANGKVDRAAVTKLLAGLDLGDTAVSAPEGPIETVVATAWSELLAVTGVGRESDFFTLGGDSLLATRLVGKLRTAGLDGVTLSALFERPGLADFCTTLRFGAVEQEAPVTARPAERHEPFAPTDVQRAYWFGRDEGLTLGGTGCHFYREYDVLDLDLPRLEQAVDRLIQRHEMLRAVFDADGNQRILAEVPAFTVELFDGDETELRAAASHQMFDPACWPLFSIRAVRSGRRTRLAVGLDNLILDALSILRFYAELSSLYADPDTRLEPVGLSFRDYVLDLPEPSAQSRTYWSERVADLPPPPRLPLRIDPADIRRPRFTRREFRVDETRWQAITDQARAHGLSPSGVLLAAFAEVLGRWSAAPELTLNLTLFDRREVHPDVGRVLGDFTSLLLVGHRPEPSETWLATARRTQGELWAALDHRDVSAVEVQRDIGRRTGDPGFTVPVVFTSALGVSGCELSTPGALFAEQVWGVSQTPQVWLDHQVTEVAGGISLNWDAVEELFPAGLLDAMFDGYRQMLDWLATADWTTPTPDLLPTAQSAVRQQVNATDGELPDGLLHSGFFGQAARTPDAVALVWGGGELTYSVLAERALSVAGALTERGVQPGDAIAVTLPKGPEQIIAVLGILAAGGTYVPIGVDQPQARRARIHRLAGVWVVIDEASFAKMAGTPLPAPVDVPADQAAYVIFTSGSTGEPKGVEITHRAALNTVADINDRYGVGPADRVLAVSALDFDLSVYDIFGPLAAGAGIVLIEEDARRDARRWFGLVAEHGVTVWNSVPALLDMLMVVAEPDRTNLRVILVSGDWVGLDLPGRARGLWPESRFVAMGGATEASIWSNAFEVGTVDPSWPSIPYGHPLRNQQFRVVDGRGRDCPDWVGGELWIGGSGVAVGYRGAPEQTARQFVADPEGRRWYRTGDLGRYWPDGTLEFLGRVDQQVKLRGHRIELGEIEAALTDHPTVGAAVASVVGSGSARRLAAAVLPSRSPQPGSSAAESASEPTMAFRAVHAEQEAQAVETVLVKLLDRRIEVIPEFEPVLRMWRQWLASRKVLTDDLQEGPEHAAAAARSDFGSSSPYGELIVRSYRRLIERLDDYRSILEGRLDASVLLDDDVLAPARLAASDAGAADVLDAFAADLGPELRIAELGGSGDTARALAERGYDARQVEVHDGWVDAADRWAYDVVIAANSFHRFPDPAHGPALASLLVKPGGRLIGAERTDLTPIAMLTAALLDRAYTGFDPVRRRAGTPMLSGAGWAGHLTASGWRAASSTSVANSFLNRFTADAPLGVIDLERLRAHVAERVPAHMVPELFEVRAWLPLSSNGKVDRAAVARLWPDQAAGADDGEPEGELEQAVAAMWSELLGLNSFGRGWSFFGHGGNSLLATRFVEAVRQRFAIELPLRTVFANPTVAAVAAALEAELGTDVEEGEL
ncbi:amino acid adenylation domain-containing protein [Kribbella sandramycini]|uniref:Phenyloxazoline synthase MbtB n=1 Tax=Kribbella sandramycini TaxID=60450 RepID=A0A7Y4NZZ5_9ACTN|nr:non-ribosomal peptide synthetase [Kribbella sandramycini]MBB6569664.1 amino acid adenylation domain-containing protein [Kribbella sandramycini]NOL40504.1 amino acid adenylation domain-containing protein [Kribbella sandramycini]